MEDKGTTSNAPGRWVLALATVAGLGYAPLAPGTAGSLGAVLVYLVLARFPGYFYLLAVTVVFAAACASSQAVQEATGEEDPQIVVIDELVGYLAAMFLLPETAGYMIAAFFVFRLLDVIKPWPASYFDKKVRNGFGIVMDDVVAGIYTNLILQLFRLAFS